MKYPDQSLGGVEYFGTYIPDADKARRYYELTGQRVLQLDSDIDAEFGIGGNRFAVTGLDLEFGGAQKKIDAGPNIPRSFLG